MRSPLPNILDLPMLQEARNPHAQVRVLLDEIRKKLNDPVAVERASDEIDVLTSAYMLPEPMEIREANGLYLSKFESRTFNCLHSQLNKVVTRERLWNAIYFDRMGDGPEAKIIDVRMCKLRKKLRDYKLPFEIKSIFGIGFRMIPLQIEGASNGKAIRKAA